jgi:hypothetical protein
VINEEETTGLRPGDHADGDGTAGSDLGGELLLGERVLLPAGLIGTLALAYGDIAPVIREA